MSLKTRLNCSALLHQILIGLCLLSVLLYAADRSTHNRERRLFSDALEAADAGRWYWDLESDELVWDDQMFNLFGKIRHHWTPNYSGFEACIHPYDRVRVHEKVVKAIAERGGYQAVFRIVTASGEIKEIRAAALVSRDGRYMTGINLPADPREGNFRRHRSSTLELLIPSIAQSNE